VEFCENIERIEKRFTSKIDEYLEKYQNLIINKPSDKTQLTKDQIVTFENTYKDYETTIPPAPRLPETDVPTFRTKFDGILKSIKENKKCLQLEKECTKEEPISAKGESKETNTVTKFPYRSVPQRILIFDNNNTENSSAEPVYDSSFKNTKEFESILHEHNIYKHDSAQNCSTKSGGTSRRKSKKKKKRKKKQSRKRKTKRI
jgi:hypothetical protein